MLNTLYYVEQFYEKEKNKYSRILLNNFKHFKIDE